MSEDSLANAAGKGVTLTIKGKEYAISPITLGDLASFEAHVHSNRIKIFLKSAGDLPADEKKAILMELVSQIVDQDDVSKAMTTIDGVRFLLWKALSRECPELTLDAASELVDVENLDEISTVVQALGGGAENPPVEEAENP